MARVPYVVAVNRAGEIDPDTDRRLRAELDLPLGVPLVACDATDRDSVKNVLLALLYSVLDERRTTSRRHLTGGHRGRADRQVRQPAHHQAVQDRASDIHIEPTERDLRVRYRIDGVLHEVMRSPKSIQSGVISRLKIMADINIAERRIPQDGRLSGRTRSARRSTCASRPCRRCGARRSSCASSTRRTSLLDLETSASSTHNSSATRELPQALRDDPGDRPDRLGQVDDAVRDAQRRQRPEVNIITVEDPVEYRLPGINQVQTNNQGGADLRRGAALDPALRTPTSCSSARSATTRPRRSRRGRAHRPPRALDAAHQRRAGRRSPA
jgi:hypothetical protein